MKSLNEQSTGLELLEERIHELRIALTTKLSNIDYCGNHKNKQRRVKQIRIVLRHTISFWYELMRSNGMMQNVRNEVERCFKYFNLNK